MCSLHYLLPSYVTKFTYVDKGRWKDVIQHVLLRLNYLYSHRGACCAGMTAFFHFHTESFIQNRAECSPLVKSILHKSMLIITGQLTVWKVTICIWTELYVTFFTRYLKAVFVLKVRLTG